MKVSLIVAQGISGQIGFKGDIPFKSDLKRFKYLTLGKTLVMGRKTYESIGKPLPGRKTIVLTRDKEFKVDGVLVAHNLTQVVKIAKEIGTTELMVAGGEEIYKLFMPKADRLYKTTIIWDGEADTYFPKIERDFDIIYREMDELGYFRIIEFKE